MQENVTKPAAALVIKYVARSILNIFCANILREELITFKILY